MLNPGALSTPTDVEALAGAMFGNLALLDRAGVVHVTALHASPDGALYNLLVGPDSPKSAYDGFALQLSRARADAILVTGRILRDEPELRYALPEPLAAWRAGRTEARPKLLVLTTGEGLELTHPALDGTWADPVIFTGVEAAARLRSHAHLTVVGHPQPSAAAAMAWARDEGARTLVVEAGPSTTLELYHAGLIEQLALSVFRGPLRPEARGARVFANEAEIWQRLGTGTPPVVIDEGGGTWTFQLFPA